MNDCLWAFMCGCCEGCSTNKCGRYISINTPVGQTMMAEYQHEVDEKLSPLTEKWRMRMLSMDDDVSLSKHRDLLMVIGSCFEGIENGAAGDETYYWNKAVSYVRDEVVKYLKSKGA